MMTKTLLIPHPAYRYAVYFAPPPDSPWWQTGSQWLGRCAAGGVLKATPVINGISDEEFQQVTAAPRRYGWHATLKAPFTLASGTTVSELRAALQTIAASANPFEMPPMQVALLDDFLAIMPQPRSAAAEALAARCVMELQPLAAALSATELQRRRQAALTPAQDALLERWGYPFVLNEFQLHCSLTGSLKHLNSQQVQSLQRGAEDWFDNLSPCNFESLALFAEPTQGADFVLQEHFRFAA
jgi:putative phosphonate metabolism protein